MSDAIAPIGAKKDSVAATEPTPQQQAARAELPVRTGAAWSFSSQFAAAINRSHEALARPAQAAGEPDRLTAPDRLTPNNFNAAAVQNVARAQTLTRHYVAEAEGEGRTGDTRNPASGKDGMSADWLNSLRAADGQLPTLHARGVTARFMQMLDGRVVEVTMTVHGFAWKLPHSHHLATRTRTLKERPPKPRKRDPWSLLGADEDAYTIRSLTSR